MTKIVNMSFFSQLRNHPINSIFDHSLKIIRPLRNKFLTKFLESFSIIFDTNQILI